MNRAAERNGVLAALAAILIWGLAPVATRFFVLKLDPITFNVVRFAISGAASVPLSAAAYPWRWERKDLVRLLFCAAFAVPGYNIPMALAARSVPASGLGLLIATEPMFILVFTTLTDRTSLSFRIAAGATLAFAGVVTTCAPELAGQSAAMEPGGILLGLFSSACFAAYAILVGPLARKYGSSATTGPVLTMGALLLILISSPFLPDQAWPDTSRLVQIGAMGLISSLLGFLLWNRASATVSATRLGLLLYLIPVVSLAGGLTVLGERADLTILAGGALVLTGVAYGEGRIGRRLPPANAPGNRG